MAWYAGSAVVFWTVCLGLSWLSRKTHPFIDRPAFVMAGLTAVFLGFGVLIGGASVLANAVPPHGALYVMMAFIPGLVLLVPWIMHALSIFADEGQREVLGIDQMTVRRSYDVAERLVHERRFEDAEREFLAAAGSQKDDPEPLRGAAEAALAAGRVKEAVGHFRGALLLLKSEEDRASLAIRIAEIEERKLGDSVAARRTLESVLPDIWPGKWGDYVRDRLERIQNQE